MNDMNPRGFPTPPFDTPQQRPPGLSTKMNPQPDYGEESYTGSGRLEGKKALITGADSGIGRAVALAYAREGADVAVIYLSETEEAKETERLVTEAGRKCLLIETDVSKAKNCRDLVAKVAKEFGRIDILVNNAGVGAQGDVAANDDDEWARVLSINVTGIARVTAAALPWLRRSPAAAICNTSSIVATAGLPQRALYSASKGAVLSLTRAMAADHLREGIRVNAVNPGTADTPWIGRLLANAPDPAAERAALEARQPHGRLVSPEEVARAVLYLVSPSSGSTTGTYIEVDGGMAQLRLRPAQG